MRWNCQQKHAGLLANKPAVTPIDNLVKLSSTESVSFTNVQAYRRLIRKLMYLTNKVIELESLVDS